MLGFESVAQNYRVVLQSENAQKTKISLFGKHPYLKLTIVQGKLRSEPMSARLKSAAQIFMRGKVGHFERKEARKILVIRWFT